MSSFEDSRESANDGRKAMGGAMQVPGLVSQLSPDEQLPFPDQATSPVSAARPPEYQTTPGVTRTLSDPISSFPGIAGVNPPFMGSVSSPGVTRQLPNPITSPGITRNLTEVQTNMLPALSGNPTSALRPPVVIRGSGKKARGAETASAPKKPRWITHTIVIAFVAVLIVGTLMTILPESADGHHSFNPFQSAQNLFQSTNSNRTSLIAQQAATATAVTQDGYDPGNGPTSYPGLPAPPPGGGSLNRFAFGQCTYWANMRYHQLTGNWVPWLGNAYQWVYGARSSGWVVSATPKVPSIIVLQAGVQGAGGYGHVAVVERINSDGSVYASNYNWYSNGGWDRLSYVTFHPGPGVSFVWHP